MLVRLDAGSIRTAKARPIRTGERGAGETKDSETHEYPHFRRRRCQVVRLRCGGCSESVIIHQMRTICCLLAAIPCFAQLTVDQKVFDFQALAAIYAKHY